MIRETGSRDRSAAIEAAEGIRVLAKDIKLGASNWAEWKAYRDEVRR